MNNYLKYLITEELYLVREDKDKEDNDPVKPAERNQDQKKNLVNKTLVLIRTDGREPFRESDRELLNKILQAVKEDPEEILQLDLAETESHQDILANHHVTNCRILGFLDILPENAQDIFSPQKYMIRSSGGFDSLLADPLSIIDNDRLKKKQLWEKLQDLFKLQG